MADRIITVTDPSIVTNDTLSGYNNYSDIDGQLGTTMTPTEATNGHTVALSDGVVHEVTTKPVGTTNGEFSAVVSNTVTVDLAGPSSVLFSDDFTGIVVDTAKWDIINTTPAAMLMYQDDAFFMEGQGGGTSEIRDERLESKYTFSVDETRILTLDVTVIDQGDPYQICMHKGVATAINKTDQLSIYNSATAGKANLLKKVNDAATSQDNVDMDFSTGLTIKIANLVTSCVISSWNGSSWTILHTFSGGLLDGNDWIIAVFSRSLPDHDVIIDNVYLTDTDFSTQYPQ